MKNYILAVIMLFSMSILFSQNGNRIEVKGKIIVNVEDVEGVTVFNASSNKGTITNANGEFDIEVTVNDKIEVSALQFIPFKFTITPEVIASKSLKVYLVERVNALDEVVILPHSLTGDIETDAENVVLVKPVVFNFESFQNFEMPDDYQSSVENIAMTQGKIRYQADVVAIVGEAISLFFMKKGKNKKSVENLKPGAAISGLSQVYSEAFIVNNYNIPRDRISQFIVFVEDNNFNYELLRKGKEMELIEHLHRQSKLFLKLEVEKK